MQVWQKLILNMACVSVCICVCYYLLALSVTKYKQKNSKKSNVSGLNFRPDTFDFLNFVLLIFCITLCACLKSRCLVFVSECDSDIDVCLVLFLYRYEYCSSSYLCCDGKLKRHCNWTCSCSVYAFIFLGHQCHRSCC